MGKAWHALLGKVIYGGFALILFLEVAGLEVPEEKGALLFFPDIDPLRPASSQAGGPSAGG